MKVERFTSGYYISTKEKGKEDENHGPVFFLLSLIRLICFVHSTSNVLLHSVQMKLICSHARKIEGKNVSYIIILKRLGNDTYCSGSELTLHGELTSSSLEKSLAPKGIISFHGKGNENKFKKSTEENTLLTSVENSGCCSLCIFYLYPFTQKWIFVENAILLQMIRV